MPALTQKKSKKKRVSIKLQVRRTKRAKISDGSKPPRPSASDRSKPRKPTPKVAILVKTLNVGGAFDAAVARALKRKSTGQLVAVPSLDELRQRIKVRRAEIGNVPTI